ncbi:hypothetical protein [Actinoplanes sp. ATCC 53533]|uniref:hypothetical protein n=1 Tax=Actinoplanes sp. ATCC 53533 TaxID=1288362 RepID=UPI000F76D484|nr:hypothetical protein [Actinoplanes sp. ATCC 53533]
MPTGSGAPTDVRLPALGLPMAMEEADDPGEPADQGGDPELDIDQDLDRAADPMRVDERSRALELPGLGLPCADDLRAGYAADRDTDMSGPFDAVDGTGAFSGLFADGALDDADETGLVPATETAGEGWAERTGLRYGDRVEGWIRPRYEDEPEAVAGEYWTPVPVGSYETEYGWPTPVERIPEIPPYPTAVGFDAPVAVEAEPTKPVPQWPPPRPDARIELPRSWSQRNDNSVDRDRPMAGRPADDTVPDHDAEPPRTERFADRIPDPAPSPSRTGRFTDGASDAAGDLSRAGRFADGVPAAAADQSRRGLVGGPVSGPGGGPGTDRGHTYAASEESLEGPIWTVPDMPEAAMPDLTWSPEAATDDASPRRVRRPAVMIRRRRGTGPAGAPPADEATQALPPMELTHPDQRARPRPRPRPGNGQQEPRSTVYVSRHAAEPS